MKVLLSTSADIDKSKVRIKINPAGAVETLNRGIHMHLATYMAVFKPDR